MPSPLETPELFDVVVVAGVASPGIAKVEGGDLVAGWENKKGPGQSGAGTNYNGEELAEFSFTLRLWLPEHFSAWPAFQAILESAKPEKGRKAQGLDISYPTLEANRIRSFVPKKIGALQPAGDKGEWNVKVDCLQFRAPAPAAGKPKTSKAGDGASSNGSGASGGAGGQQTTAEDERDKLIEELTAEVDKLA